MSTNSEAKTLVIIPARGGSKGIPLKNLRRIGGQTLLARAIESAFATPSVLDVVVSTDHPDIKAEALANGATVIDRPAEIAGDTASSESVLLHALGTLDVLPQITVFIQCTSPVIDPADLQAAITTVASGAADVSFAVVPDHGFHWSCDETGAAQASGHDAARRPRRQDREPRFRETGAFYVMDTAGFLEAEHRFFGSLALAQVPEDHGIDIDTEADLALAQWRLTHNTPVAGIDVDALVTDFDGVHTPDTAYLGQDGSESVRVSRSDGMGISLLKKAGIHLLILSTETNPVVTARATKLGVEVAQAVSDKATVLNQWIADRGLDPERVAYLGNDVNDLDAMNQVGWPLTVADAQDSVHLAARHRLSRLGGRGAVREAADLILAGTTSQNTVTAAVPASGPLEPSLVR
ncbi:acylneuraminate cytidylyltransferase [Paeniglutamicibacter sulfureus]|uniref:acylneuraminate cytidylyltransferase n=1 Tax=Paeniglutamicibacter sulfureus TaxID=43666 RepID=UPI00266589AA|nr:acylneuraminate cytidylyltransferase [Paeniglutamicibacter sulfureus]MDO2934271.1 acylneuraminate cytidylyltransferase [Paeniglutamicibacter sulfureus]